MVRAAIPFTAVLVLVSCSHHEAQPASRGTPLIYGTDDRREVHAVAMDPLIRASVDAVAAVIPRAQVRFEDDGSARVVAPSLSRREELCSDEPFATQPSAAECTAVLVDDNLVATAGHCFRHELDCQNYLFVFGYVYEDDGELGRLEAYECRRAQVQENDLARRSPLRDYAIVELSLPVEDRRPVVLRDQPLDANEAVVVISATQGLPLKVDSNARVLAPRSHVGDYFLLEADTFTGSSGAPVLDRAGALAGVFARGKDDYMLDEQAGCERVVRSSPLGLPDGGPDFGGDGGWRDVEQERPESGLTPTTAGGDARLWSEEASYLKHAIEALCNKRYPSRRLCGIAPTCGDAVCSPEENATSCVQDCEIIQRATKDDVTPGQIGAVTEDAEGEHRLPHRAPADGPMRPDGDLAAATSPRGASVASEQPEGQQTCGVLPLRRARTESGVWTMLAVLAMLLVRRRARPWPSMVRAAPRAY